MYDNRDMNSKPDTAPRYKINSQYSTLTTTAMLSIISERLTNLERVLSVLADRLAPVPEQLSRAEAAKYAGVSEATIDRWRAMGRLTRLTGPSRVLLAELRACVAGKIPDSLTLTPPSGFTQVTDSTRR